MIRPFQSGTAKYVWSMPPFSSASQLGGCGSIGKRRLAPDFRSEVLGRPQGGRSRLSPSAVRARNYELTESTELALNVTNVFDEKHAAYGGFSGDFFDPGREVAVTVRHRW